MFTKKYIHSDVLSLFITESQTIFLSLAASTTENELAIKIMISKSILMSTTPALAEKFAEYLWRLLTKVGLIAPCAKLNTLRHLIVQCDGLGGLVTFPT